MPREPPAPIIGENSPSSATWRPASTNSAGMMTLPLAPTMPTKIITIPKRGRSREFAQKKATPARMEKVAVVVIVRAARAGSTHAPSRPARTNRTPSARALAQRQAGRLRPPKGRATLRIATFPITAFSDETRSTESPATWPSWAAHCPARHTGASNAAPSTTQAIQPSVRERAPTASSSGMLAMKPRRPPHPRSMRRARARADRRGHHQPTRR